MLAMAPSPVVLRSVFPSVPKDELQKQELIDDLTQMGCEGLLAHPWSLKNEGMVGELTRARSNEWEGTLRRKPEEWTEEVWSGVYSFPKRGGGWASRTDKTSTGRFHNPVNPKDGYAVADCVDPRERRMLEFVVPILYPEKPTRLTLTVANTLFGALSGDR